MHTEAVEKWVNWVNKLNKCLDSRYNIIWAPERGSTSDDAGERNPMIVKDIDPSLVPSIQALNQMSPAAQQAVITVVKQLAETEGIAVASTLSPGLQAPAEGIDLWVTHLLALGFAPRSVELYRNNAQKYLEHDPSPTRLSIQMYIAKRLEEVSPARVGGELKALKSLFGYLHEEGLWLVNPTAGVRSAKVRYRERQCPDDGTVMALLQHECRRKADTPKFRMMVFLLATTGLRVGEAVAVLRRDIDLPRGRVRVVGKGGKERYVPLLPETAAALREYLAANPTDSPYLFPAGNATGHQDLTVFEKSVRRACDKLGVPRTTPHQLRHYYATVMLQGGAKLEVVSRILGHAGVGVTADIYRHVGFNELAETAEAHAPRLLPGNGDGSGTNGEESNRR